jgi:Domain of unknown function (DUF1707)
MPASYGPPWGRGSSYRRATPADPNMRVSNTDRTEVADRLSKHYGDGRLDEDEFNERLDRAMKAKTQADLHGLFADLPDAPPAMSRPEEPMAVVPQRRRRPLFGRVVFIILAVVVVSSLWHAVMHPFWGMAMGGLYIPWLLIGVIAFLVWRSGAWHRRP